MAAQEQLWKQAKAIPISLLVPMPSRGETATKRFELTFSLEAKPHQAPDGREFLHLNLTITEAWT